MSSSAVCRGLVRLVALCTSTAVSAGDLSDWTTPEYLRSGALVQINAAEAYALGFTGAGVTVGIADSGIDTRHPEFAGRLLPGYDFMTGRPILPGDAVDFDDHGTHVAGIVAAARDGVGMHGVAFNASVIPAKLGTTTTYSLDDYFSSTWAFLVSQGATIINNSFSADKGCENDPGERCNVTHYSVGDVERMFPHTIERQKAAVAAGTLMVFAAGNENQSSPDVLAAMPHLIPELEKSWLAVVSVDANNQKAADSDRCGVAKNFCLAAPGVAIYSTAPINVGNGYMTLSGTSQAAPVVSGVAALVKEAFPWFTAHDIQQTLLTTATDIGAPGVDDVYGWGLVNAGKAVLGYGMFAETAILDTNGMTSTFRNDISGSGGLIKTGAGELVLDGANTYAGDSFVESGILSINGSTNSAVLVGTEGTLRGTGSINAPLTVAGRLAPGNSPGTLTVAGPVTLSSTATFQIDIDGQGTGTGAGNFSRVITTGPDGTVAAAGTLLPTLRNITGNANNTFTAALGTSFSVIQTSAGLSGSFSGLVQPTDGLAAHTRFDALYGANGLSLIVTPESYGNLSANGLQATANVDAVGGALDRARPSAGVGTAGALGALYTSLYRLAPTAIPSALHLLSGEIHASARTALMGEGRVVRESVIDRLRSALNPVGTERVPVMSLADVGLVPALPATDSFAIWGRSFGSWGHGNGDGNAARLDRSTGGFFAGGDGTVLDDWRFGVLAGYTRTVFNVNERHSSGASDNYHAGLYGGTEWGALAFRSGLAYTWHNISTRRSVIFPGFSDDLDGRYSASTSQMFGEFGYSILRGNVAFEPFANLAYASLRSSAFTEMGGAAILSGTSDATDAAFTTLGLRSSNGFVLAGIGATTRGSLGWQHTFGDVMPGKAMTLAGGLPFTVAGAPLVRDAAAFEAGLDLSLAPNAILSVSYNSQLALNSSEQSVRAIFNLSF